MMNISKVVHHSGALLLLADGGYPRPSYLIRFDVSSLTAVNGAGHLGHDMTECRIDPLVITTYVDKM